MQGGFFDQEDRLTRFEKLGDPLRRLESIVDWQAFRPLLKLIHQEQRKIDAGRKPHHVTLMFEVPVLQSLYKLSDDQAECQVRDRLSFRRLGEQLSRSGLMPRGGQIAGASPVNVPKNQTKIDIHLINEGGTRGQRPLDALRPVPRCRSIWRRGWRPRGSSAADCRAL